MAESRGRRLRRSLERGDGGAEAREVSDADDTPVADGRDGPVPADREVAPRLERPVVERVLLDADGTEPNQDVVAPADAFRELDAVSLSESLREHTLDLLARLRRNWRTAELRAGYATISATGRPDRWRAVETNSSA